MAPTPTPTTPATADRPTPAAVLIVSADAELSRAIDACEEGNIESSSQHYGAAWSATTLAYEDDTRSLSDEAGIIEVQRRIAFFILQTWIPRALSLGLSANARLEAFRLAMHTIEWLETSFRVCDEKGIGEPEIFARARQRAYAQLIVAPEASNRVAPTPARSEVN